LDEALNHFKLVMRLLISFDNCMLGFSNAETIDLLLNNVVVDLSSVSGEEHIKITSSSSSLFSFGRTVGLTHENEIN